MLPFFVLYFSVNGDDNLRSIYDDDFKKKVAESVKFMENSLNDVAAERDRTVKKNKRLKSFNLALTIIMTAAAVLSALLVVLSLISKAG